VHTVDELHVEQLLHGWQNPVEELEVKKVVFGQTARQSVP
jgi:hypothetical protein